MPFRLYPWLGVSVELFEIFHCAVPLLESTASGGMSWTILSLIGLMYD